VIVLPAGEESDRRAKLWPEMENQKAHLPHTVGKAPLGLARARESRTGGWALVPVFIHAFTSTCDFIKIFHITVSCSHILFMAPFASGLPGQNIS
jgi:hypothetical protein